MGRRPRLRAALSRRDPNHTSMTSRHLLSSTLLYGIADIATTAVGGFLLLPLYTRALTPQEFGMYVAVRANIDILTYLIHLGLPSATGRLYLVHKERGEEHAFLSTLMTFFLGMLAMLSLAAWAWGDTLWGWLSPETPADPNLAFAVLIAAVNFPAAIASIWLRMEQRVVATVSLQVGASLLLALIVTTNLLYLETGLDGILVALALSPIGSVAALVVLFGRRFRLRIEARHLCSALGYAMPMLVGYVAYFVLNRVSTLVLQRHASLVEVGVFGLAQQLSLIVGIAIASFGMALQPAVYREPPEQAMRTLRQAGRLLVLLGFGISSLLVLFADDLLRVVAPQSYGEALPILLILIFGNALNAFILIYDTAVLYHRRPKTSVAISLAGAALSTALALTLVEDHLLFGAAVAVVGGLSLRLLLSLWQARELGLVIDWTALAIALPGLALLILATRYVHAGHFSDSVTTGTKLVASAIIGGFLTWHLRQKSFR